MKKKQQLTQFIIYDNHCYQPLSYNYPSICQTRLSVNNYFALLNKTKKTFCFLIMLRMQMKFLKIGSTSTKCHSRKRRRSFMKRHSCMWTKRMYDLTDIAYFAILFYEWNVLMVCYAITRYDFRSSVNWLQLNVGLIFCSSIH